MASTEGRFGDEQVEDETRTAISASIFLSIARSVVSLMTRAEVSQVKPDAGLKLSGPFQPKRAFLEVVDLAN